MIFNQSVIISLFSINKFLISNLILINIFCATEIERCCFLLKCLILKLRVQYGQYCILLDQSHCRHFVL